MRGGEGRAEAGDTERRPAPECKSLKCYPEGFELFPTAKEVSPELPERGSDLFLAVEKDLLPNKETYHARLQPPPSGGARSVLA